MRFPKAKARAGIAGIAMCAAGVIAHALPDVNTPIDPAKRAPVSTSDAVRPSSTALQGDGVIGGRVIRMSSIPLKPAAIGDRRSAIQVAEAREKNVIRNETKQFDVRPRDRDRRQRAGDLPASIPRLSENQFQKIITAYEEGRVPAREFLQADIGAGDDRVSIGEINRYANPRRALEAQGIPVRQAASAEEAPAGSTPVPLPLPGDKR